MLEKKKIRNRIILVAFVSLGVIQGGGSLASDAGVNLYAPAMQRIKEHFAKQKSEVVAARKRALLELVARYRAGFDTDLDQNRRTGNIRGMAVARKGLKFCEEFEKQIEETGTFEMPTRIRRELRDWADELSGKKDALGRKFDETLEAREKEAMEALRAELRRQGFDGTKDPAAVAEWFGKWVGVEDESAEAKANLEHAGDVVSRSPAPDLPDVIATSGTPPEGSEWLTFALWEAEINAITLFTVPVLNRAREETKQGVDPVRHQPFTSTYRPVRVLSRPAGNVFRVKTMGSLRSLDVVEWPSRRNNWSLMVRARPGPTIPSRHGMELQVVSPDGAGLPRAGTGKGEEVPIEEVEVLTQPDGAVVYVDGVLAQQDGNPLTTPCRIDVARGEHSILLRKRGYLDAKLDNVKVEEGTRVTWVFRGDPDYIDKKIPVAARFGWQSAGLRVKAGQSILVRAYGTWSCGSGKEEVDADGYPNDERFFKYYLNPKNSPRQVAGEAYGKLLMRIGRDGPTMAVGKSYKGRAPATGAVYFDINEEEGGARRDNHGRLQVHFIALPR